MKRNMAIRRTYIRICTILLLTLGLCIPTSAKAAKLSLAQLQQKFPNGRYWNGGNVDKTTDKACALHYPDPTGHGGPRCNYFYDTTTGYTLTQCWGFAFKLGLDAYGTTPGSWTKKNNLNSLKAGDIVRYGNGAHVVFITAVSGNNIVYADCNKNLTCQIRWGVKATKSDIPIRNYKAAKMEGDGVYSAPYALNQPLAGAITISNDRYLVESGVGGGQYMTVYGNSLKNEANIATYKSTLEQSVFTLTHQGKGYYKIINQNSGKSLDIPGQNYTVSGRNVQQYSYEGLDDQMWVFTPATDGYYYIRNKCGGHALDVKDGKAANGTNIQLHTWNKSNAQKWKLLTESRYIGQTLKDGDYYIRSNEPNRPYLSVGKNNNIELINNRAGAVVFHVQHQSSGRYKIIQKGTGLLLEVTGKETVYDNKNVMVSADDGYRDQLWILKTAENGTYEVVNRVNGARLDVLHGRNADGTNVQVYHKNNAAAQRWVFEPISNYTATIMPLPILKIAKTIIRTKDNKEAKNSSFSLLQAKAGKTGKKSVKLTWNRVKGADKYIIYGNACGRKNKYKKLYTVSGAKTAKTIKKIGKKPLKRKTFYKFIVVAIRGKYAVSTSKTVHAITRGSKTQGNPAKVLLTNVKKNRLALKKGKTFRLGAKAVRPKGKKVPRHRKLAYESADPTIATVSSTGKVTAKKHGTTKIYVYAQNGQCRACTVTVK